MPDNGIEQSYAQLLNATPGSSANVQPKIISPGDRFIAVQVHKMAVCERRNTDHGTAAGQNPQLLTLMKLWPQWVRGLRPGSMQPEIAIVANLTDGERGRIEQAGDQHRRFALAHGF
jgi:hypothetical protein